MRRNRLWYELFRRGIVRAALDGFYTSRSTSGSEHIPAGKPVIFVANHQNSFLDALHVVCNTDLVIHFLTRADPFDTPLLGGFLRSLNMLPVYRVRDGFGTVKKNEKIFDQCIQYLGRKEAILVFAEANHDMRRRVRPLSKGFTRFAFGAEVRYDWGLDLAVIPVGINYGDHQKARRPVHVAFGEAIPVAEYKSLYLQDERTAAQRLKKATSESMKRLTMHVANLNRYPLHRLMLDELEPERADLIDPREANRRVALIEEKLDGIALKQAERLLDTAERHGIAVRDFVSPPRIGVTDMLLSPLYLFSLLNNLLPYQPVRWTVHRYIEDHVFDASAKFLIGLVLFPLYYTLVAVLIGLGGGGLASAFVYFGLSMGTASLFPRARELAGKNTAERVKKRDPGLYRELEEGLRPFVDWRNALFGYGDGETTPRQRVG